MIQIKNPRLRSRFRGAFLAVQPVVIPASWFTYRMCSRTPTVALTFDDGPSPRHAPTLLGVLARFDSPATFFYIGQQADAHPELVREACCRGHLVCSHGYDHSVHAAAGWRAFRENILRGEEALRNAEPAACPRCFRPPRGQFPRRLPVWAALHRRTIAMWSIDSGDSFGKAQTVLARTHPDRVMPGDVILMHEDNAETLRVLPEVIDRLRDAGYAFVTMACGGGRRDHPRSTGTPDAR